MDYYNRMYYYELEEKYKTHFPMLKTELVGKGQDGITAAQRRKLWAIGVNVTGIHYKGSACAIIDFVERLNERKTEHKTDLYQVIYKVNGRSYKSKHLYTSESDADYAIGKNVPPKYDAHVEPYKNIYYMTKSHQFFADISAARETGESFWVFKG